MTRDEGKYSVRYTAEFSKSLDEIQAFFSKQGDEVLQWWFSIEDRIINEIDQLLSYFPYMGKMVEQGPFRGSRCLTYGKSRHRMLNYLVFYMIYEEESEIYVINILPSRSDRERSDF